MFSFQLTCRTTCNRHIAKGPRWRPSAESPKPEAQDRKRKEEWKKNGILFTSPPQGVAQQLGSSSSKLQFVFGDALLAR